MKKFFMDIGRTVLKILLLLLFLFSLWIALIVSQLDQVRADDGKSIMPSYVDKRTYVIQGKGSDNKGYLMPDPVDKRRTVQKDKRGNVEGYWQEDYVDPRRSTFFKKKKGN